MKIFFIFLIFLIAFAVFVNAKPHHPLPPHKQAAIDACLTKLGLTKEKTSESKESSEEDNDGGCLSACVDKELGLMTADGNINREAALKDLPPFIRQAERTKIVDTCLERKGDDECETSKLYHSCLRKLMPHPHMDPALKKLHDDCKDELNLTDEDVEKLLHPKEDLKKNCYRACLMKRLGFLNNDGTFNKEDFLEKIPQPHKEMARKFADTCGKEVRADECETAALMYKCFIDNDIMVDEVADLKSQPHDDHE